MYSTFPRDWYCRKSGFGYIGVGKSFCWWGYYIHTYKYAPKTWEAQVARTKMVLALSLIMRGAEVGSLVEVPSLRGIYVGNSTSTMCQLQPHASIPARPFDFTAAAARLPHTRNVALRCLSYISAVPLVSRSASDAWFEALTGPEAKRNERGRDIVTH